MSVQVTQRAAQASTTGPNAPTGHGHLRAAWYRIRFAVQEMNYATRRVTELQAPWIVDQQWHTR
jgi:hypothetical protein